MECPWCPWRLPNEKVTMSINHGGIVCCVLALFLLSPGQGQAQAVPEERPVAGRYGDSIEDHDAELSEAEDLLWKADHLQDIGSALTLNYLFRKDGTMEESFTDDVVLKITELHEDGTKSAELQFLSGSRQAPVQPRNVQRIRGNPVIGMYMQGDIYEMGRLTGGNWRYFQRRLKLALAETAKVVDVRVKYEGKEVDAKKVTIYPYDNDPKKERYPPGFSEKAYEFTFSDEIPGQLYSIRTIVPGNGSGQALLEETLSIAGSEQ